MTKQKTIYELGLHECTPVDPSAFYVMRVPGGWLYCSQSHHAVPPVFVPYSEEFLPENLDTIPSLKKEISQLEEKAHRMYQSLIGIAMNDYHPEAMKMSAKDALRDVSTAKQVKLDSCGRK